MLYDKIHPPEDVGADKDHARTNDDEEGLQGSVVLQALNCHAL
jgi:hypothetical protein